MKLKDVDVRLKTVEELEAHRIVVKAEGDIRRNNDF